MNVNPDVNYDELARMTDDFNGAQLKVRFNFSIIFSYPTPSFYSCCCCVPLLFFYTSFTFISQAVCVEAGMIALRRGASELTHEDFVNGVAEVQANKKPDLQYYV